MRVLIWLIFFLVLFLAVKSRIRAMQENMRKAVNEEFEAQAAQRPVPQTEKQAENMVACAHCQLFLPASEAVQLVTPSSRQYFCSDAHFKAFSAQSTISSPTSTHE